MVRQSGDAGLVLDNSLTEKLIKSITETTEKMSAEDKQAVLVVSPAIRKQLSNIIRHHIDDMIILSFTELPDNRKITVVSTITSETNNENNK